MYISGPNFPRALADAPPWARQALERFERVQKDRSGSIGFDPKVTLEDGDALYFPNVAQPMGMGAIGVIVAVAGLAGFGILAITQALFGDGVPGWTWMGMGGSVVLGFVAIVVAGVLAPKPGAPRTDGMYLVPEGLVLVRKNRCAAISRSQIQEFRAISTSDGSGSSSYSESVVFTNDSAFRLVAGKRPELRARWEAWRTAADLEASAPAGQ